MLRCANPSHASTSGHPAIDFVAANGTRGDDIRQVIDDAIQSQDCRCRCPFAFVPPPGVDLVWHPGCSASLQCNEPHRPESAHPTNNVQCSHLSVWEVQGGYETLSCDTGSAQTYLTLLSMWVITFQLIF